MAVLRNYLLPLILVLYWHPEVLIVRANPCPPNHFLINGMCWPNHQGTCAAGHVYVNGQCCSSGCIQSCQGFATCSCCNVPIGPVNQGAAPCPYAPVPPTTNPVIVAPSPAVPPCNSATAPCPTAPAALCNGPVAPCPTAAPCNAPAAPCNAPVAPCPTAAPCTAPAAPCNTPATPCPTAAPCNAPATNPPTAPCPNIINPPINPPIYPPIYPPIPPCLTPTPPPIVITPTPIVTTPTPTAPPTTPRPGLIIRPCPPGTVLINGICRQIYCGKGFYQNGNCIQTVCPAGTVWTGNKCSVPEYTVQPIVFNSTVYTYFNHSLPPVTSNNVNNLELNNTIVVPVNLQQTTCEDNDNCNKINEPETERPIITERPFTPEPVNGQKCCNVLTPRVCKQNPTTGRWNCYSRRYRRCGDFCIAPTIYLKVPQPRYVEPYVVMPPQNHFSGCRQTHSCAESNDPYDCSGCSAGIPESCSSYCYSSPCTNRGCAYYDQQEYCPQQGCGREDGCFDDWCSNGGY